MNMSRGKADLAVSLLLVANLKGIVTISQNSVIFHHFSAVLCFSHHLISLYII